MVSPTEAAVEMRAGRGGSRSHRLGPTARDSTKPRRSGDGGDGFTASSGLLFSARIARASSFTARRRRGAHPGIAADMDLAQVARPLGAHLGGRLPPGSGGAPRARAPRQELLDHPELCSSLATRSSLFPARNCSIDSRAG